MNWHTSTDEQRVTYLIERRTKRVRWYDIGRELHVCHTEFESYKKHIPKELLRFSRHDKRNVGRCPACGWLVDTPGECELCQLQRRGQVVLYRRLEAMHG